MLSLLLVGCQQHAGDVDAADYDSFWLWAGVKSQPVLDNAKSIYILEAEIRRGQAHLIKLRAATPHVMHANVWLVYRVETLDWGVDVMPGILADLERWRAAGNRVAGVQIDFDAATKGLSGYAGFLRTFRANLPAHCQLSVTGLLDWGRNGDPDVLNALAASVDEVVLQTYQGRHTIAGYEAYFATLDRLKLPFRIGLVQGGNWQEPSTLAKNHHFKGYVVFLVNPETK